MLTYCGTRTEMTCAAASKRMTTSFCALTTPWDIRVFRNHQILSDLPKAEAPAPVDEARRARIERDISFVYPYAAQTKLATKVAASALAAEQAETEATLSRPAF